MPNDDLCYVPADVVKRTPKALVLSHNGGSEKTIMIEDASPVVSSTINNDYSNLETLEDFSEPAILYQIRQRFLRNFIYTYVSNIVIAVNPYQLLFRQADGVSIYSKEVVQKYEDHLSLNTLDKCEPHVFGVAARAFLGMCSTGKRQSVLISGESGAGKTVSTKLIMTCMQSE